MPCDGFYAVDPYNLHEFNSFNPNYHPLLENRDFSGTEPPLDLRPVCKFKFVRCGPVEKNLSALSASV